MKKENFIKQFADLFDETDATSFTMETRFKELEEWSSMIIMGVIAMADEEYGVRLKGDDIRRTETIEDLYNVLKSRVGNE